MVIPPETEEQPNDELVVVEGESKAEDEEEKLEDTLGITDLETPEMETDSLEYTMTAKQNQEQMKWKVSDSIETTNHESPEAVRLLDDEESSNSKDDIDEDMEIDPFNFSDEEFEVNDRDPTRSDFNPSSATKEPNPRSTILDSVVEENEDFEDTYKVTKLNQQRDYYVEKLESLEFEKEQKINACIDMTNK